MSRGAARLLLLADAANPDAALALAAEWRRDTGNDVVWCLPAGLALLAAGEGDEILEMPPTPTPGGAVWSALCRTLAAGFTPLLALPRTPGLGLAQLRQAQVLLEKHDAVFSMTAQGCALAGLARAVPELFAGVPWETGQAMAAVRAQARRHRCTVAEVALAPD